MKLDLDELEKLEALATPGPWFWRIEDEKKESDISYNDPDGFSYEVITRDCGVYGPDVPTCEFIIYARNALPALIKRLRELEDHCNTFCKCPTHGASLIHFDGEMP